MILNYFIYVEYVYVAYTFEIVDRIWLPFDSPLSIV